MHIADGFRFHAAGSSNLGFRDGHKPWGISASNEIDRIRTIVVIDGRKKRRGGRAEQMAAVSVLFDHSDHLRSLSVGRSGGDGRRECPNTRPSFALVRVSNTIESGRQLAFN